MPFKQIRAFMVRCSPRACKVVQLDNEVATVQSDNRVTGLQSSSPFEGASASDWVDEEASSWDGEPPELPRSPSFIKRSNYRQSTAAFPQPRRVASPPPQGHVLRKTHVPDSMRLRVLNHELTEHLDKAELDLSQKHVVIAEMEEDLKASRDIASKHETKGIELEKENVRLSRLVGLLATSRWRPIRELKQRLMDVEARARQAEGQIAKMKEVLAIQMTERADLKEEAYELWEAILMTGEQAGAHRADHAMSRLSIRFDFEDSHV